jgi:RimK family alpha-L-glutamate ligase
LPERLIGGAADAELHAARDDEAMRLAARAPRAPVTFESVAPSCSIVAIVGARQQTNLDLAEAWHDRGVPAALLSPNQAAEMLVPGDTAILRLDVLPTLDGIEDGLDALAQLPLRGVRVVNSCSSLVSAHDKLRTARRLVAARLPHPKTVHLPRAGAPLGLRPPFVVKPRYGSWGDDVFRCLADDDVEAVLSVVQERRWFRRHGALLQELVPSQGRDLRLVVAGGRVVGAAQRIAPEGEWRTNVSLGAARLPMTPSPELRRLAVAAAASVEADFVGVDVLPVDGGYVVIEINAAVEFDRIYDLDGGDVYTELVHAIALPRLQLASG